GRGRDHRGPGDGGGGQRPDDDFRIHARRAGTRDAGRSRAYRPPLPAQFLRRAAQRSSGGSAYLPGQLRLATVPGPAAGRYCCRPVRRTDRRSPAPVRAHSAGLPRTAASAAAAQAGSGSALYDGARLAGGRFDDTDQVRVAHLVAVGPQLIAGIALDGRNGASVDRFHDADVIGVPVPLPIEDDQIAWLGLVGSGGLEVGLGVVPDRGHVVLVRPVDLVTGLLPDIAGERGAPGVADVVRGVLP